MKRIFIKIFCLFCFFCILSVTGSFLVNTYAMPFIPCINANGLRTAIDISHDENLSITIKLDCGSKCGKNADWWIAAATPFGWYHYDAKQNAWGSGAIVAYQGSLFDLPYEYQILKISSLPTGKYTFYFGADLIPNNSIDFDELYYDSVIVNCVETVKKSTRSGPIYSDERWSGTIEITGDVGIYPPATVTIEPGTIVRFAANSDDQKSGGYTPISDPYFPNDPAKAPSQISDIGLFGGTLIAVGTIDSPIVFTSSASTPDRGDWHSIAYHVEGSKLNLRNTIIEYGYYGIQINTTADNNDIAISDNTIRHIVACGICGGCDPERPVTLTISGNDMSDCGHEAIDTHSNATLTIKDNVFHDNLYSYGDGPAGTGVIIDENSSTISNNIFIRNRVGIGILSENSSPSIYDNYFSDNDNDILYPY